jgi:hypothetical protein
VAVPADGEGGGLCQEEAAIVAVSADGEGGGSCRQGEAAIVVVPADS